MGGILDTIELAGVLIFAIPAALAGLDFLLVRDEPLIGATFLGVAVGLVLAQRFLSLPTGKTALFGAIAGKITPEESAESTVESADGVEGADDTEE